MKNTKKSKRSLKLLKQKHPANYFQVNIIIVIFICFNLTTLTSCLLFIYIKMVDVLSSVYIQTYTKYEKSLGMIMFISTKKHLHSI